MATSALHSMTGLGGLCRQQIRLFSVSRVLSKRTNFNIGATGLGDWRLKRGMGPCGNEYGPLAEIPDWSYADGTPAGLSYAQKARQQRQTEMCERIVQLTKEVKFAKENYIRKKEEKERLEERRLAKKLSARSQS